MPFTDAEKNNMLDGNTITHAALFNGIPDGAGTEVSGGAYARQAVTPPAASGGEIFIDADETFEVPAGSTVNYVAYYDALTAGTLLAYDGVTEETYGDAGQYILESTTLGI